jgi:hypothetical protein
LYESRILEIERRLEMLRRQMDAMDQKLTSLGQLLNQAYRQSWSGSGSGTGTSYWIKSPGFSAATGSFPSLTESTGTADVYSDVSGTMTLYQSSQTIRWWYKDAGTANRLVMVLPTADNTAWDAVVESCTGV